MGEGPLLGKALGFVQSGGINVPGVGRRSLLQARTSPIEVDVLPDSGKIVAKRADFLIGGAGRGTARCQLCSMSLLTCSGMQNAVIRTVCSRGERERQ